MKKIQGTSVCIIMAMMLGVITIQASDNKDSSASFGALSKATQIELPAKAAELIVQSAPKNRQKITVDVVKSAVGLNPAAAPAIVASIAKASPVTAAVAAATAASLVPDQVLEIARVAAVAAPEKAGEIVAAVVRVCPKLYKEIATVVAAEVPSKSRDILVGLSSAIPMIQAPLNKVLTGYAAGSVPTVSTVLAQIPTIQGLPTVASTTPTTTTPTTTPDSALIAPPTYGSPYVNPSGSHINLDPGSGSTVPTNGRSYSGAVPP